MNGTGRDSQNSGVWRYRQVGRRAVRLEVRGDWYREPLRHGYGLRSLLPGQTGSSLPEKGLNTATGAAGEGCNEKAAFITPGIQKAE
ncbi:hypothetical protein AB2E34_25100 (plasmid) [Escherichia coli]